MISKICFTLAAIATVILAETNEDRPIFRNDYTYRDDISLHIKEHTAKQKWDNAVALCKAEGAVIFVPKTQTEVNALLKIKNNDTTGFWVGIHDNFFDGQFITVDGKSISELYNKWAPGEPNDENGKQNCVLLNEKGLMVDEFCDLWNSFFCVRDASQTIKRYRACDTYDSEYIYNTDADRCYKLHLNPLKWGEAFRTCQAEQSNLAIINSVDEINLIINMLAKYPIESLNGNFHKNLIHLGFNDLLRSGQFATIEGQSLRDAGYDVWAFGQPDNFFNSEHCGSMYRDGTLNDIGCENVVAMFVCEKALRDVNTVDVLARFGSPIRMNITVN